MEFITQAEPLLKAFWYIAIFTTVLFTALMLMSFAGGGDHSDFDTHAGGGDHGGHSDHDFQILSFRNLVNFLLGVSWSGIALYAHVSSKAQLIAISITMGCAMVWLFFKLMKTLAKLTSDNTQLTSDAVGKVANVYLTIPAQRSGKGKVLVSLGGSLREFDAITDGEQIGNGTSVAVESVLEGNVLVVALV